MMNDYERVTELQTIAQRSQGATMAQMAVYGEGMEAALNRLNVSWEKIVTSVTDSEAIIGLIQTASNLLNGINDILQNEFILITSVILISGTLLNSLMQKYEMQKATNRAALEEKKIKLDEALASKKEYLQELKSFIAAGKGVNAEKEKLKVLYQQNKTRAEQIGDLAAVAKYTALIAELDASKEVTDNEITNAQREYALTASEIAGIKIEQAETDIALLQNGQGFVSILGNALAILTPILAIMSMINLVQQTINNAKLREIALTKAGNTEEKKGLLIRAKSMFASVIKSFSTTP